MISPIGSTVDEFWNALVEGRSGIKPITRFDTTEFQTKIAGEVRNFDPTQYVARKTARRMDYFVQYAVAAALQAVEEADLKVDPSSASRVGVMVGSATGASHLIQETVKKMLQYGPRGVSAYNASATTGSIASGEIAILLGAKGPSGALVTACATGNSCVGEAMRIIQDGRVDVMIAGGTDDAVTPMDLAQFSNAKILSSRNEEPERASRPFDRNRDGFVIGAGAGVVVVEAAEHASKRGAPILAELVGYGATTDAHHVMASDSSGAEAKRAMLTALEEAQANPAEVDYINAHGTATRLNDEVETRVIQAVLGEHAKEVPVSSNKSMIGHLIGGAGAVELIATVHSVLQETVPPTINCEDPEEQDMNYVPHQAQTCKIGLALNNSFGLGGHNAVLAVRRWNDS